MIRSEMKKNMTLTKKQQKRVIEQARFTYSSLGKALEKQTEKLKIKEKN